MITVNSSKSREKKLVILTAIIISALLVFVILIEPKFKEREKKLNELGKLELKLTKIQSDILVKDRIDAEYEQIAPLLAGAENQQQEISLFTRQVSDIYSKLGVKIRAVKILPVTNEEFYRKLMIKVEMSCNAKDMLRFIHGVEMIDQPVKIEKLDLKATNINNKLKLSLLISKVIAKS